MKPLMLAAACMFAIVYLPAQTANPSGAVTVPFTCKEGVPECTHQFVNGQRLSVYTAPAATVIASIATNGKYTRLEVTVTNTSTSPVDVLPDSFKLHALTPKDKMLAEVPTQKIVSSERRRAGWADALNAFGSGMASQQVTTQTNTTGTVHANGSDGSYSSGTYNGTSTSTTTVPDYAAQARARENIARRRAALAAMENDIEHSTLRANTVQPGATVSGFVYFENEKHGQEYVAALPIGTSVYEFPFTIPKK